MRVPRYAQVAAMVRVQVAKGGLTPGMSAPSGAALARATGYSVPTCRRALRVLIADGVLVQGASRSARPRVPGPTDQALAQAKHALSAALARRRRAAGLTQPQLAERIGVPVTNVGHAETERLWHSRRFWESADKTLKADGELLRLHDAYRAAEVPSGLASAATGTASETGHAQFPAAVKVNVPEPVECITITWAGGAVTTVHPPNGHRPAFLS